MLADECWSNGIVKEQDIVIMSQCRHNIATTPYDERQWKVQSTKLALQWPHKRNFSADWISSECALRRFEGFQKIFESKLNYSTEVFDPLGDLPFPRGKICISSKDEHERTIIVSVELYNVASILSVRKTVQNNNQREVRPILRAGINIYANNFEYWIVYIFDHCYRSINLIFNVLKLSAFWNDSRNWNGRLRLIKAAIEGGILCKKYLWMAVINV